MEINFSELIWTIVNFLILMVLLVKFLWKPFTNIMDTRRKEIEDSLVLAEQSRKESSEMQARLASEIDRANKQAREIVETAQKTGEQVKADIVATAAAAAAKVTADAEAEIERKKREAINELQSQVADLVVMVSGKVLAEGMNNEQQKSLVNKYVKEVGGLQ